MWWVDHPVETGKEDFGFLWVRRDDFDVSVLDMASRPFTIPMHGIEAIPTTVDGQIKFY